ncbi:MAG: arylsulfatase, partial [Muribaculaceae bacterium]|nr:arylsulfatase [Muribaculaceae bacterium]
FILCDDMGYGDLGCYGQPYIETPNIDRMASEGMLFTQAYAGSPVSAPSRATIMTGQHTGHTEVRSNRSYGKKSPRIMYGETPEPSVVGQHPYSADHIILPEIMKANGYATAMFGKWAGGYEGSHSMPETRGIDEFFGFICQAQAHLYFPNFLNRYNPAEGDTATVRVTLSDNIPYPIFGDGYRQRTQYSADMIHEAALDWIGRQNADTPFFGMLTYTLPHAELSQPEDSLLRYYKSRFHEDKTWGGKESARYNPVEHTHAHFAAMISRLDIYVGEVLAMLKEKGLDENTLVIFASDNGPHEEGGADPEFFGRDGKLRGIKRSCHEGGIRIPFIARWPEHVPANTVNDHQLAFYDLLPTFCDIAGISGYPERFLNPADPDDCFDGISFATTLLGKPGQRLHEHLYWEFAQTDYMAVRKDDWKLVVKEGVPHLYDLAADIHEDNDLSASHPEILSSLIDIIYQEHRPSPLFKVTLPKRH